jgi:FkbM family methyltransferase
MAGAALSHEPATTASSAPGRDLKVAGTISKVASVLHDIWADNRGLDKLTYLVSACAWQVQKRLGRAFVTTLASGARVRVQPNSAFSAVFYSRWLEEKDIAFIRRHAGLADTFVDVGANVGLFSALLFDRFSKFYLVEPSPSSFAALQATCALNPSVECLPLNAAASDAAGELAFLDDGPCSSTSRVAGAAAATGGCVIRVEANTLDAILAGEQAPIVLKIDVEGWEERVFGGARRLFADGQVKLVMFERLGRTNLDRILSFFGECDYVVFFVRPDGAIEQTEEAIRRPLINLFACPRALFAQVADKERRR